MQLRANLSRIYATDAVSARYAPAFRKSFIRARSDAPAEVKVKRSTTHCPHPPLSQRETVTERLKDDDSRKGQLCKSPSKAGGLPSINQVQPLAIRS